MGFVVDTGIKAQVLRDVKAFFGSARNANDAAPHGLTQLTDDGTNRPAGSTDHQCLAGFGLADLRQPHPSGYAGHAHWTQVGTGGNMAGADLANRTRLVGVDHAVGLPPAHANHRIARLEIVMGAGLHHAHRPADHDAV